jgi:hypothetical protein
MSRYGTGKVLNLTRSCAVVIVCYRAKICILYEWCEHSGVLKITVIVVLFTGHGGNIVVIVGIVKDDSSVYRTFNDRIVPVEAGS